MKRLYLYQNGRYKEYVCEFRGAFTLVDNRWDMFDEWFATLDELYEFHGIEVEKLKPVSTCG